MGTKQLSIHPMSSRSRNTPYSDAPAESMYHHLRVQGVPASEAWRHVRDQFPQRSEPSPQPPASPSITQVDVRETAPVVYANAWKTLRTQTPIGVVILLTIIWIAQQCFWAVLWMIGFTARVLVGIFWFGLGFLLGFRAFSR